MEIALKSALSEREIESVRRGEGSLLLLLYEDPGFVNGAIEVLRAAAHRIDGPGRLVCALRDIHLICDPLLMNVSAREAREADMIVIASLEGTDLPRSVRNQVSLWLSARWGISFALAAFVVREGCVVHDSQLVSSEIRALGRLGKMELVAIGRGGAAGSALKKGITRTLADWSEQRLDMVSRTIFPGEAAEEGERLGRAAAAFSG